MERIRYIYRITNNINGKTYIGQHTVRENGTITSDTYWGSGKILWNAYKKYGKENFKKEILISGEYTREEINKLEIEFIEKERLLGKAEYNISKGGNFNGACCWSSEQRSIFMKNYCKQHPNFIKKLETGAINTRKKEIENGTYKNGFLGKSHSEETKKIMSEKAKERIGEKNNQFGKHWFTNGKENIYCKDCPSGFWPGRVNGNIKK